MPRSKCQDVNAKFGNVESGFPPTGANGPLRLGTPENGGRNRKRGPMDPFADYYLPVGLADLLKQTLG